MVLMLVFIGLVVALLIRSDRKTRKLTKAWDLHNDMFNKYVELAEDPFVTDAEWKEWLPIFEEADRICARDCPDRKFDFISLKIIDRINDEESTQD